MKLTYLNYKEPLKPVEHGYGYVGTLAQTEDGSKVQCHICGELHYNLGSHVFNAHGLIGRDYRRMFELALRTPLCSDKASEEYKQRALKLWNGKTPEEQQAIKDKMSETAKNAPRKPRDLTTEELNRKGICPDQLLERINKCAEAIGKTPSAIQFNEYWGTQRFLVPIKRTFGSWKKACEYAGLTPNRIGGIGGRVPTYTNEQLLQRLRDYNKKTGRVPTATDCNRGYLPTIATYRKRFGGIREARKLAGLQELVSTREWG